MPTPTPRNFFQDPTGDYSASRLCQVMSVAGGISLAALMAFKGDHANAAVVFGTVMTGGTAYAMYNRSQEAKEAIVDMSRPSETSVEVKA